MTAYYNEIDPYAAQWLRNLIAAGHIAPGDVDERSIEDVRADDLVGYRQCHFFAGIGVWSYALQRAGWADDREVWTGSCPCQPFSDAGTRAGLEDRRHLWPVWSRLIRQQRPIVVFGEQVASRDGLAFIDLVHDDLEAAAYTIGAVDTCAAGVGAPHIRQRLFFVGALDNPQRGRAGRGAGNEGRAQCALPLRGEDEGVRLVQAEHAGTARVLGNASGSGLEERPRIGRALRITAGSDSGETVERTGAVAGFWADAEWLACFDGKARPVEPGTFPLAHGTPARVGRLRAYGNAINGEVAAEFIRAYDSLMSATLIDR